MYIDAIENEKIEGVYNGVAPCPVNNKTFMMELGRKLKGENFLHVHIPSFMLKIILGEMGTELIKSCTVCSDKIKKTGFQFIYPTLGSALTTLL
jgi:NAD dependent epimerase/dehydratase family enzyme